MEQDYLSNSKQQKTESSDINNTQIQNDKSKNETLIVFIIVTIVILFISGGAYAFYGRFMNPKVMEPIDVKVNERQEESTAKESEKNGIQYSDVQFYPIKPFEIPMVSEDGYIGYPLYSIQSYAIKDTEV